ncbi:MAG: hypothetical protein OXC14_13265 [Rhodospirillaceae bacterium]|nr:hypothetical protein [Rhodospirillaceae bacterium]
MTDEEKAVEALAMLAGMEQRVAYLSALIVLAKNYPPEMTEVDRKICDTARTHLFEAAYEFDDWLGEALRRCTPAERGWCMWLNFMACGVVERLSE